RGEHHTLGEQLPHDGDPATAERDARRDLGGPYGRAHEQERGNVDAGEQEEHPHGAPEHQQGFLNVGRDALLKWRKMHRQAEIGWRLEHALQRGRSEGPHLPRRVGPAYAWAKAGHEQIILPGALSLPGWT